MAESSNRSMTSRKYILSRRGGGIGDMSQLTLENGDLSIEECEKKGLYQVNCKHQVGIATATEVGLSADRYPIRVIITSKPSEYVEESAEVCASYWTVCTANGEAIKFNRKPIQSELALKNLYKYTQDFDTKMWALNDDYGSTAVKCVPTPEITAEVNSLYELLGLQAPTSEQIASIVQKVELISSSFMALKMLPCFKIGENIYLYATPHGTKHKAIGPTSANKLALHETAICMAVNRIRLKQSYTTLQDGVITLASYSIANMFRGGMQECFEHKEYYTALFVPDTTNVNNYTFHSLKAPSGITPPTDHKIPAAVNVSSIKLKSQLVELANMMVMGSGLMHYLFNHTTGGMEISGVLLSAMAMYNFVSQTMAADELQQVTSVMYEALHPTNKRAIANLLFPTSGVLTHGRSSLAPRYCEYNLDAFSSLRSNPYPAGSHKAFVCITALKRVLQSGMGPFLPWAGEITSCVTTCKEVLQSGARAHIGAHYYTGEPPRTQPSALDRYLPELAQFLQTFHALDSLSMSPHMSREIGKRADMNWQNLLKDMKSKDVSATAAEKVREFLATTGGAYFNFDPEKQETWAGASQTARTALQAIEAIFV